MSKIANLNFKNLKFSVASDDLEHLQQLALILNERAALMINNFVNKSINDSTLLYLVALTLQNEVMDLQEKLINEGESFKNHQNDNKQQITESVSDTIDYIANYIESVAKEIEEQYN